MDLREKANEIRFTTFDTISKAGGGHFGGSLSISEILTVLYCDVMRYSADDMENKERDRFVLSKGHAGPALYVMLAELGIIDKARLSELDKNGGSLPKHVDRMKVKGIEFSTGPLGQGFSAAAGMALGLKGESTARVYALLGDGELDEGQVWETAMAAAHYKLDNFCAIVDVNGCQVDGKTADVMSLEPIPSKWKAFGWNVIECDGHDTQALKNAFSVAAETVGKPSVIIAKTHKGKGVSFMEDQYKWHSGSVTPEQYETGKMDLMRSVSK